MENQEWGLLDGLLTAGCVADRKRGWTDGRQPTGFPLVWLLIAQIGWWDSLLVSVLTVGPFLNSR
eukprot:578932-Pelagomonas_calceolata.AAC.1